MNNIRIGQALVKIYITDKGYQTGFLFTDDGHILSVGHSFDKIIISPNQLFKIHFESDPVNKFYQAKLIDFQFDKSKYTDFSVFKITTDFFYQEVRYKLPIASYNPKQAQGKDITITGYADAIEENVATIYNGKVLGTHPISRVSISDSNFWLQMKISTQLNLTGVSGAPVMFKDKVIAIQNSQSVQGSNDCFATPINCINSRIVRDELNGRLADFYLLPQYFEGFRSANETHRSKKIRNALFISDPTNFVEGLITNAITDYDPKEKFIESIDEVIKNLKPLVRNAIPKIELRIVPISNHDINEVETILNSFDDQFEKFSDFLRFVVDTGNHSNDVLKNHLKSTINSKTHIVGIAIHSSDRDYFECSIKEGYDIFFSVFYKNHEYAQGLVQRILFGVLLDIAYFWSIPGLRFLISDIVSQKSFSLRKSIFSHIQGKRIFNECSIPEQSTYVSFAWFFQGETIFDHFLYSRFWNSFLSGDDGIFAKMQDHTMPLTGMTIEEIKIYIKNTPKLASQISDVRLDEKLNSSELSSGVLSAVLILVKKPKGKTEIARVRTVFARQKLKSIAVLPVNKLAIAMKISHLIKFYYFIKKS